MAIVPDLWKGPAERQSWVEHLTFLANDYDVEANDPEEVLLLLSHLVEKFVALI
jgi:hypothetical protein